jgi:hypothetical protein
MYSVRTWQEEQKMFPLSIGFLAHHQLINSNFSLAYKLGAPI